jgi:hypothetical protein
MTFAALTSSILYWLGAIRTIGPLRFPPYLALGGRNPEDTHQGGSHTIFTMQFNICVVVVAFDVLVEEPEARKASCQGAGNVFEWILENDADLVERNEKHNNNENQPVNPKPLEPVNCVHVELFVIKEVGT